jgi:diaminohydroxyphosphoribosylaminopyrimidine deaminase/5-amino-6-(5-phosphoribosylamino)uracil reductase
MLMALRLAARARGRTSPNPMVGAVIVRNGRVLGRGYHRRAGFPHAEIEALLDAERQGHDVRGATLYVTLEPCCTHGRTPPCTAAIINAGIAHVVVGATDPNPAHRGRGFGILRRAGITVTPNVLQTECAELNAAFNHWMVQRTPLVTVKAAMTLDGKIATAAGVSKWITGPQARRIGMRLRQESDAILVGINTILADDPSLTLRGAAKPPGRGLRRIILDALARTPLTAKVVQDGDAALTTIVVTRRAPARQVAALSEKVQVVVAPERRGHPGEIDLRWILRRLGREGVTALLVEGGGEVNGSFLAQRLAHRVCFFYAPMVLGGKAARRGVAHEGASGWKDILKLTRLRWSKAGPDLVLRANVG